MMALFLLYLDPDVKYDGIICVVYTLNSADIILTVTPDIVKLKERLLPLHIWLINFKILLKYLVV